MNDDRRVRADMRQGQKPAIEELHFEWIFDSYAFDNLPVVQVFTHKNFSPPKTQR